MAIYAANGYPEEDATPETEYDAEDMDIPLIVTAHNKPAKHSCLYQKSGDGFINISNDAKEAKRKIILTTVLCVIFMATECIGGYLSGSLAIMTDAAHLLSDCISFIVGLMAIWVSNKPPDKKMSFGYKRIEVLGAIISVLGIWALTVILFYVAIKRIITREFTIDADSMMVIAGIGIAINITMVLVLHGSFDLSKFGFHSHSHCHHKHKYSNGHSSGGSSLHLDHSPTILAPNQEIDEMGSSPHASIISNSQKQPDQIIEVQNNILISSNRSITYKGTQHKEQNINLRAAIIHVLGDLIQSIGVFIASIIIKINPNAKIADPVCTLLFSFIVLLTTYQVIRQSLFVVMDAVPDGISLAQIERDLINVEGVRGVHDLNVWSHSVDFHIMMAHLITDQSIDYGTILRNATALARSKYNIKHATFQIEAVDVDAR